MKARNQFLLSGVAGLAIAGLATPVMAQTTGAAAEVDDSATNEIIVTALKREQDYSSRIT